MNRKGHKRKGQEMRHVWSRVGHLHRSFRLYRLGTARFSRWLFSRLHQHSSIYLQSKSSSCFICRLVNELKAIRLKRCSHVLLPVEDKAQFMEMLKRKNMPYLNKKALRKKIHEKAKKNNFCFNCGDFNGFAIICC